MKITISCSGGTMRTIHLARRLDRKGLLAELHIPHHRSLVNDLQNGNGNHRIDVNKMHTCLSAPFIRKLAALSKLDYLGLNNRYLFSEILDRQVAKRLERRSDIVLAESNIALHTLRKAKQLGAVAALDRTNSHIQYQNDLLNDEYAKLGIHHIFNSKNIVEKGMQEYHEADYICVLSSFVKKTFLAKSVPAEKLLLIPSGVSLTDFRQVPKEDDAFRVIFCGLASIKKGVHYLLEAFHELKLKNAELWFIGGIYDDVKHIMARYAAIFKHFAYIPHGELYKYFSQGTVFVLPSLEEGMAKVVMEAMACGLPVIATTNTGAEDIYENDLHGFIIPIQNKDALKDKLLYCYENQDICRSMGELAKEKIKQGLTWNDYADRVERTFSSILTEAQYI